MSSNKRYRAIVGKFVARMRMRSIARCFDGLVRGTKDGKRERMVVEKFRKKWMNTTLARGGGGGRGHVEKRKWCRGILLKCMNAKLAGGWGKWVQWVEWGKGVEDEERRREIIMDKFVKNMKMREAGKCMRRWMEVVRERKWLRGLMSRCVGGTYFAMLGDGFEIWKNKVEKIKREEVGMTVEKLRKVVDEQRGKIEVMEEEIEGLRDVRKEYVCSKVVQKWAKLWGNYVRGAFGKWKMHMGEERSIEVRRGARGRYGSARICVT